MNCVIHIHPTAVNHKLKLVIVKQLSFQVHVCPQKSPVLLISYSWKTIVGKVVHQEAIAVTQLRDDGCLN